TTRFPLPELERRKHARTVVLGGLNAESARGLLRSLDVQGGDAELDEAAAACGRHAKAVELLGTYLVRYASGQARRHAELPAPPVGAEDDEGRVARVLLAHQAALTAETRDLAALATAFRDPPTEARLL